MARVDAVAAAGPPARHGVRCFIWWCNGHGAHAPGLLGGWAWRRDVR